tara:strand:+ start:439 stop:858 length:420 start_codon:yes stop_codon:yes gene_type:complete
MADGYALATQVAIIAALKADSAVTALVGQRIYDEPPSSVVFPYIMLSDISPVAWDTDHQEGAIVQIGLHAHSRATQGRVEAVRIAEAAQAALHRQEASLSVSGHNLVEFIFQTYVTSRDTEGRGYTSRMAFQALLEATA